MKKVLTFLLFFGCSAQNEMNSISIENIKESYSTNDTLQITLTNKTNEILFYYIGIECYIDNEWREVESNIDNPNSKSTIISKLQINERKDISFHINFIPIFEIYRLKINYGNKVNFIDKQNYSQSFKILKGIKKPGKS